MQKNAGIIGRVSELEILEEVLQNARKNHGGVVLVSGAAGVGKSTLVNEALTGSGLRNFRARAVEERNPPDFIMLRNLLTDSDLGDELISAIHSGARVSGVLRSILPRLCGKHPVALFLDDAQWADSASLEILEGLASFLQQIPVALFIAFQDDAIKADHPLRRLRVKLRREKNVTELTVGAFNESEVAELMSHLLHKAPSPQFAQAVFERTGGLPLFVEELCKVFERSSEFGSSSDAQRSVEPANLPLPETIRDLISVQVSSLSQQARDALECAAIIGLEFQIAALPRLGVDEKAVDELLNDRVIVEKGGFAHFPHAMLRQAVLEEISWSRRRKLNSKVADLLARTNAPPRVVAAHLAAAGREGEACATFFTAAEEACAANAYREASSLFRDALTLWPDHRRQEERLSCLERMARCAQSGGCLQESARAWRELLATPSVKTDPIRTATALGNLATIHELMGAEVPAREARDAAISAYESAGLIEEAAKEALAQAETGILRIQLAAGRQLGERALALAQRAERPELESRAMSAIGLALAMEGKKAVARRRIETALELALSHGLKDAAAVAYQRMSYVFAYVADFKGQKDAFGAAINYCRREGLEQERIACIGCMSYAMFRLGEWKRATELCREIIDNREPGDSGRMLAEATLGGLLVARGQVRQARKMLNQAEEAARKHGIFPVELLTRPGLAWLEEQTENDRGAALRYRELISFWRQTEDTFDVLPGLRMAARFFARTGEVLDLGACAEIARVITGANRNPETLGTLAFVLGETALLQNESVEASRQFQLAKSEFAKMDARYEVAECAERLGASYRQAGVTSAAVKQWRESYRILKALGARPLLEKITVSLQQAGYTVGEERATGKSGRALEANLTRRQLEVAKLVAEGLTNKEVAQRLHLSPRTVDMHVASVLDRLDCHTRSEAVRKLVDLGFVD